MTADHREMGQGRWIDIFRVTNPLFRRTLESKRNGKLSIHFCADEEPIGTVFRRIIFVNQLSIYGAISDLREEYKVCQARTGVWASKFVDENTYTFDRWSCTRRSIAKVPRTSGKTLTTIVRLKFALMEDSWQQLESDSTSWRRTLKSFHIHRISVMSWVYFVKRWKIIWPERLDSREHQNWARVGSHNQLPAR